MRFVGELYKEGLLTTSTMFACIEELVGSPGKWKENMDTQEFELLIRLMKTVGSTLEAKANEKQTRMFEDFFRRITSLSKDKSVSSRIRFSLEEVLELRRNGWQARRAQEGPLKISEIHERMQKEEEQQQMQQMQQQQMQQKGGYGNRMGRTSSMSQASMQQPFPQRQTISRQKTSPMSDARSLNNNMNDNSFQKGRSFTLEDSRGPSVPPPRTESDTHFKDERAKREITSTIKEYLNIKDIKEVVLTLQEKPMSYRGYFILSMIEACIGCKSMQIDFLYRLISCNEIVFLLSEAKPVIAGAIASCEELKALQDTAMDNKEVNIKNYYCFYDLYLYKFIFPLVRHQKGLPLL